MTYKVPTALAGHGWVWPRITNDQDLAVVNAELSSLAECGCQGGCRCPLPALYHQGAQRRDYYRRDAAEAILNKLRAYRDLHNWHAGEGAFQDDRYHETATTILAELIAVIGWKRP